MRPSGTPEKDLTKAKNWTPEKLVTAALRINKLKITGIIKKSTHKHLLKAKGKIKFGFEEVVKHVVETGGLGKYSEEQLVDILTLLAMRKHLEDSSSINNGELSRTKEKLLNEKEKLTLHSPPSPKQGAHGVRQRILMAILSLLGK